MDQSDRLNVLLPQPKIESLPSRATSLRAYATSLINSNDVEQEEIGEDLIEFANQWEAELKALQPKSTEDAAGILIRPQIKLE